jgi:hypothetical protein
MMNNFNFYKLPLLVQCFWQRIFIWERGYGSLGSPRACRSYNPLNPWFVTGFTDAEGCFYVGIGKNNKIKTGWEVQPAFKIELHRKETAILRQIQEVFNGVGHITLKGANISYRVRSLKDLGVIITHFDRYPLITQKYADFELFKSIVKLMETKEHVTPEGLRKILSIKASLNKGLPEKLKAEFPDIMSMQRPLVVSQEIKDPY